MMSPHRPATGRLGLTLAGKLLGNYAVRAAFLVRPYQEAFMDWNRVEGNWKQVKGKVKEQWGKLTDDDLDVVAGKRDQLEGRIQERYGYEKDRVKKEVDDWYSTQKW